MLAAVAWLLSGCSMLSTMNPVNWWHRQEGGKIAEQRPAPPGADQPYPSIATVPAKPEAPDAEALKKLTDSLIADRTNAQHAAQSAPLADPSSPIASPGLFGVGTAPPPPSAAPGATTATPTASASMPAVNAPPPAPAPAAPPAAAPRKPVQSTPLEAPAAPSPAVSGPTASGPPALARDANTEPAAPQPALPVGPPPRPGVAGPAPVAAAVPEPAPAPAGAATIVFLEGNPNLAQPAADEVKAFAAKRGNATIGVTGYGDAASSDPTAQSAALNLGLSRAQSIADALKAAGVPGNAIRIGAEASGRGASLHLLQ
jgi:outer membrane protein OmpA-like peptidoglycan-associated protein